VLCKDHIESAYFSCEQFPLVCTHCGQQEGLLQAEREQKLRLYLTVHPMCEVCKAIGMEWITARPVSTIEAEKARRGPVKQRHRKRKPVKYPTGDSDGDDLTDGSGGESQGAVSVSSAEGDKVKGWSPPVQKRVKRGRGTNKTRAGKRARGKHRGASGRWENIISSDESE